MSITVYKSYHEKLKAVAIYRMVERPSVQAQQFADGRNRARVYRSQKHRLIDVKRTIVGFTERMIFFVLTNSPNWFTPA